MNPRLIISTLIMCVALIYASSFMHLTNAGLGSPDSYGVIAPDAALEAGKTMTAKHAILPHGIADRIHRGVANVLQLLIIAVAFIAFRKRKTPDHPPLFVPMAALLLSLILAFLGAWFGSPLRYPLIMMTNLAGGFALLALFWWLLLDHFSVQRNEVSKAGEIRSLAVVVFPILIVTIMLGAWTDAYYAGLACPSLPDCLGQWLPGIKLWEGLSMSAVLDVDGQGMVIIDQAIAADIHIAHRITALAASLMIIWLGIRAWFVGGRFRVIGVALLVLVGIQFGLGIAVVLGYMSIVLVVCHNMLSALLVIGNLTLIHRG